MLRWLYHLQIIVLILFLTSCAPGTSSQYTNKGQSPLSSKELFVLLSGNSLQLEAVDFDATIYFEKSGTLSARDRLDNTDTGKWDISSENHLCLKFSIWYYGDTKCYSVFKNDKPDSFSLFTENGARYYSAEYMAGNPKNLAKQTHKTGKKKFVREQLARDLQNGDAQNSSITSSPPPPPSSFSNTENSGDIVRLAQNCPDCNLAGVNLRNAHLVGANLAGADLSGADLTGANLRRADLTGADLSGATLVTTNLAGARMVDCNLSNADLTGSNLIKAKLDGATTTGATFTKAHMESIEGFK